MKNLKDIIIGIFAVIGVLALVTGFTNDDEKTLMQKSQILATPESHVWEFSEAMPSPSGIKQPRIYVVNKVTGEVKLFKGGSQVK